MSRLDRLRDTMAYLFLRSRRATYFRQLVLLNRILDMLLEVNREFEREQSRQGRPRPRMRNPCGEIPLGESATGRAFPTRFNDAGACSGRYDGSRQNVPARAGDREGYDPATARSG